MIRVLVADDHYLVRRGVRTLLDSADDIKVVGEAENGREAVSLVEQLQPDVVIMDVSMPEMDGIKATERIAKMGAKAHVVMLSMYGSVDLVEQAIKKGASGYLLKRSTTTELLEAVRTVRQGEIFLSPALAQDFNGDRSPVNS